MCKYVALRFALVAGLLIASGCEAVYDDNVQVLSAEWAAPGALSLPGARGVRVSAGSVIGGGADATSVSMVLGLGKEGIEEVVTLGVQASLGLELLTLIWGSSPPDWSPHISPVVAAGAGILYGEAHDRGLGIYAEAEAGIAFRLAKGFILQGGYRGALYAAGECGATSGGYVRLGFSF